ncbi:MAG TPA: isopentenyl-diphosphate Delta-isomerase [archaeon]|nr:isopentenyl-diphosphate Delta-isomerase [archaeon]
MEQVVLVDNEDNDIGLKEKMEAHKNPVPLHRAISVIILNNKDEMLITKRASTKKTWHDFWSNTCCSHPRKGETPEAAAKRRMQEELGFSCDLDFLFKFTYEAKFNNEWGEHELDHIFLGYYDGPVHANAEEIGDHKFVDIEELKHDMEKHPEKYTPWFKLMFKRVMYHIGRV